MIRSEPVVAAWIGAAAVLGFATATVAEAVDWSPLVAPAAAAAFLGAFGLTQRGRDIVDVVASALIVSYAAFIGLAIARSSQPNVLITQWRIAPLTDSWPAVLVAGVPYALILTICIAVPMSLLPRRSHDATADHERFWTFVRRQNDARMQPVRPRSAVEQSIDGGNVADHARGVAVRDVGRKHVEVRASRGRPALRPQRNGESA